MEAILTIWNTLHDGEITIFDWVNEKELRIFVNIPYIRKRIAPIGDSFVLYLRDVKSAKYLEGNGDIKKIEEILEVGSPQILSTKDSKFPILIETTLGNLELDYLRMSIYLDSGQEVAIDKIEEEAENYWKEWQEKFIKNRNKK